MFAHTIGREPGLGTKLGTFAAQDQHDQCMYCGVSILCFQRRFWHERIWTKQKISGSSRKSMLLHIVPRVMHLGAFIILCSSTCKNISRHGKVFHGMA